MAKIALEKVVKKLKLVKVVVTFRFGGHGDQLSFLAVTKPVTTVNDLWPTVIFSPVSSRQLIDN